MRSCKQLVEVGRRQFLRGGGAAVGAAAAFLGGAGAAEAASPAAGGVVYTSARLANVKDLRLNEPKDVSYPDVDAPGGLLKLGKKVPGRVGPDGDIVGLTTVCPHKGFPLFCRADGRTLNCPGHYS